MANKNFLCDWPSCNKAAFCRTENIGGAFVCRDHFQVTNGKSQEDLTEFEVKFMQEMYSKVLEREKRYNSISPKDIKALRLLAKEIAFDYPYIDTIPVSELLFVIQSAYKGLLYANSDLHKLIDALKDKFEMSSEDIIAMRQEIVERNPIN